MSQPQPMTPSPNLTGQEIGDYRVLRRLGAGGMAEVYLAEQRSLGRQVALKVLHAQLARDVNYVQRFLNEARAAAALVHSNIVQIYEVGEVGGVHFIAQEYVAGKNLAQVMERQGAFQPGLVLDILRQVVSALCKAHELGIIHRDIKPENILFSNSGEVKVADFGLARMQNSNAPALTQADVAMGTPLYMSPEQIEGRSVDVRSDIYSLGATSYHLLTGAPPHTGDTALAIALQHLNRLPQPLENVRDDLPSGLARLVHQMLSKKAEQRPASPGELLAELRKLASEAESAGWAEGPGNWSLAEWIAAETRPSLERTQLSELMQVGSRLDLPNRKWGRLVLGLLAATLLGMLLAAIARPRFLLAGSSSGSIPVKASAEAQLYHAKRVDSEAAWLAAVGYEGIDPYLQLVARKGLVRCYLLVLEDYRKARQVLLKLQREVDAQDEPLRAFILAGLCIANQRLGNEAEAMSANEQLDMRMRDELRRSEIQVDDLLQTSLDRLLSSSQTRQ
ncbi:MAG: serine/threonine protein kinase [Pirellulales bacterium]|nr:serine/threonine protein kinase [Pirellulales bacterium]